MDKKRGRSVKQSGTGGRGGGGRKRGSGVQKGFPTHCGEPVIGEGRAFKRGRFAGRYQSYDGGVDFGHQICRGGVECFEDGGRAIGRETSV